jgi:hypothetical protein
VIGLPGATIGTIVSSHPMRQSISAGFPEATAV